MTLVKVKVTHTTRTSVKVYVKFTSVWKVILWQYIYLSLRSKINYSKLWVLGYMCMCMHVQ